MPREVQQAAGALLYVAASRSKLFISLFDRRITATPALRKTSCLMQGSHARPQAQTIILTRGSRVRPSATPEKMTCLCLTGNRFHSSSEKPSSARGTHAWLRARYRNLLCSRWNRCCVWNWKTTSETSEDTLEIRLHSLAFQEGEAGCP